MKHIKVVIGRGRSCEIDLLFWLADLSMRPLMT